MKKFILPQTLLLLLLLLGFSPVFAAFGIYESYTVVGNTYYDLFATTGNTDFDGANLGTFTAGSSLNFNGGEIKTYKESRSGCNGNACGGTIYWAVKSGGSTLNSGNYALSYNSGFGDQYPDMSCGINQQWNKSDGTANILAGLSAGNYTLEVYCKATGNQSSNSGCGDNVTQGIRTANFTVSAPAPVELTVFNAKVQQNTIQLYWETASEHNNNYFEVQRSEDARDWSVMDNVLTNNGNASYRQTYIYTDKQPSPEVNYYRLRQVDLDGRFEYTKIVQASAGIRPVVHISPNPATESVSITLDQAVQTSVSWVKLFDSYGRLLQTWNLEDTYSNQVIELDINAAPPGLLFLQMEGMEACKLWKK